MPDHPALPVLDLRQIVAIDALARTRSFKLAAAQLNTTQPTLSRLIAAAEAALGVTLFRRGWSGTEPTPRGDVAARLCHAVVQAVEEADAALSAARPAGPPLRNTLRFVHLLTIEAVAREGSVTRAAERLGRSQPDLSRALSEFQSRYGLPLFTRTPGGMQPLPAALRLAALSAQLRHQLDRLPGALRLLERELTGRVAIGMLPFSGQDLVPKVFARLTLRYPNIRLICVPGSYNGLTEALRRHEIDRIVGILRGPACPSDLIETPLYAERFTVVARQDHPLADGVGRIADLADAHWIVAPLGTPVRSHFEALFAGSETLPPTQTCEMLSFAAAEQMLVETRSLAMLTYSDRSLARLRPDLCELRTPFPETPAPIGLTRLPGEEDDPALAAFDSGLAEVVAELHGAQDGAQDAAQDGAMTRRPDAGPGAGP